MNNRFLYSILSALFGIICTSPAFAEHPWKDAPQQAKIVADTPFPGIKTSSLIELSASRLLALTETGAPVVLNPETGTVSSLVPSHKPNNIPALSTLTYDQTYVWGITAKAPFQLLKLSKTGQLIQTISLEESIQKNSHLTAVAISQNFAFIADEGNPALIALSLETRKSNRFLSYDISLKGHRPLLQNHSLHTGKDNLPVSGGNIRYLALSPHSHWLFYAAASGPLYRIDTTLLTDPNFTPVEQLDGIVQWRDTPSLGGISLSNQNLFFFSDITNGALLAFGPERTPLIMLHDPRFINAGALTPTENNQVMVFTTEANVPHILKIALPSTSVIMQKL
ncbi:L-dopachrome tautomerase-related protein [Swingsia samuiensis]|uniref:Uncharacterized protein n=1 Tax=Swingsia samuiensis TaxID=1293412 RepID=A0A4Y6UMI7_9PROT|nr:L-dopachrome tautomerase-related protein [Swingsia samuiensis]QDH17567.1 hypothetical protein E3D00_08330 [Swingsia samuiensis]